MIVLHTPAARLELGPTYEPCAACGTPGAVLHGGEDRPNLAITIAQEPTVETVTVCGQCLAGGLAITLGAAHVRAGGDVRDLTIPPAE